ncbi:hypothetical protein A4G29_22770 [Mycobacterium kansasii]|nr:hypothetical protein A4G29_22770 [Mycobacterium kansasii]
MYLDMVSGVVEAIIPVSQAPPWEVIVLGTATGAVWMLVLLARFVVVQTGPAVWLEQFSAASVQLLRIWLSGWSDRLLGAVSGRSRR